MSASNHNWGSAISSTNRGWSDEEIADNYFKGKTIVITGEIYSFPVRDTLAGLLKSLGARVTSSISAKTSIVVMGYRPGPVKLEKVDELRASGSQIYIMMEKELLAKLRAAGLDL